MANTSPIGSELGSNRIYPGTSDPAAASGGVGAPAPGAPPSGGPRAAADGYEIAPAGEPGAAAAGHLARLQAYIDELSGRAPGFRDRMATDPRFAAAELLTFVAEKPDGAAFLATTRRGELEALGHGAFPGDFGRGDAFAWALQHEYSGIFSRAIYQALSRKADAAYREAASRLEAMAENPARAAEILTRDGPNLTFLRGLGYDAPGTMRLMARPPEAAELAELQRRLREAAAELRGLAGHEASTRMDPRQYGDLAGRLLRDLGASSFARDSIRANVSFVERVATGAESVRETYEKAAKAVNIGSAILDLPVSVPSLTHAVPTMLTYDAAKLVIGIFQAAETQRLSDLRGFAGVHVVP